MSAAVFVAIPGSYRIAAYARAARQIGLQPVVVTSANAAAVPAGLVGIAVPFDDYQGVLTIVRQAMQDTSVAVVLGLDDGCVEIASKLAEHFDVTHNSVEAALISRRKDLSRHRLRESGLPVPEFSVLPPEISLFEITPPCDPPWVVKPVDLSASRGVIRANTPAELRDAVSRSRSIATAAGSNGSLLIEQYIDGGEIAVEGMISRFGFRVVAIFDKPEPLTGPYFEESIYVTPTGLDRSMQNRVGSILQQACDSLGIVTGPVHAEFRITEDEAWILELATRTIGGDCGNLFQSLLPVSIEQLVLENATGRAVDLEFEGAAGVCMLPVRKSGVLRRVNGVSAAQDIDGIVEVSIAIREGYELTAWPEGCSYPGFVFAEADSPAKVVQALTAAAELIEFTVSPSFPVRT